MKLDFTLFGCLMAVFILGSCAEHTSISFMCEKDQKDNYIVKWEVFPEKDSVKIEIFSSDNDSTFPKVPARTTFVNDYIAILSPEKDKVREFFKLKVGRTMSGVITNRVFDLDSIRNFRDMGGYFTRGDKQLKWGKVYRSGNLSRITEQDKHILESLGIKTVVDLRSDKQTDKRPNMFVPNNYVALPISVNNFDQAVRTQILEGRFLKGDALIYTQDCYRVIIDSYAEQFAAFFDVLANEENYPVLFHCGYGKDRTGLAAYFLLKALDVPTDVIEDDYLMSNEGLDKLHLVEGRSELPVSMQDAIAMLSTADLSQLRYAISCMKKKSGSVEDYMIKELKLTHDKRDKLRQILLYSN